MGAVALGMNAPLPIHRLSALGEQVEQRLASWEVAWVETDRKSCYPKHKTDAFWHLWNRSHIPFSPWDLLFERPFGFPHLHLSQPPSVYTIDLAFLYVFGADQTAQKKFETDSFSRGACIGTARWRETA